MAHEMTPGEAAFYRCFPDRHWLDLSDDERETWERGARMAPVGAVIELQQAEDRKVS